MRHPMRGPLGVQWVYIHALSHGCCFCEGELKRLKTKEAEPLEPSLRVCTFASGKEMLLSLRRDFWVGSPLV